MRTYPLRCYQCGEPGTTREHVPPKSIFPDAYRKNLITVPSCPTHNLGNSRDVEYVRNILTSPIQTNEIARQYVLDKVSRSYDRSPALLRQTFDEITPVIVMGQQTAAFNVDMERLERVMIAIAYGIHFHYFKKKFYGGWNIVCGQFISMDSIKTNEPDGYDVVRRMLKNVPVKYIQMPHPQVFACGVYTETPHKIIMEFRFYEGLVIHAASIPFYYAQNRIPVT
jgi:hypothetical protein